MKYPPRNHRTDTVACSSERERLTAAESLSAALHALDATCMHVESATEHCGCLTYTERTHCLLKAYLITCALRRLYDACKR